MIKKVIHQYLFIFIIVHFFFSLNIIAIIISYFNSEFRSYSFHYWFIKKNFIKFNFMHFFINYFR